MKIGIEQYLCVSAAVFMIGIFGIVFNRKNTITVFMAMELMLLAINLNFVAFSAYRQQLIGQIFSLFILTVSAAEIAIGLAILIVFYRKKSSISVDDIRSLKG